MSTMPACSDEVTDLLFGRLNDVNSPAITIIVSGDDRTAANDGGGIFGLIDDASLRSVPFLDGCGV